MGMGMGSNNASSGTNDSVVDCNHFSSNNMSNSDSRVPAAMSEEGGSDGGGSFGAARPRCVMRATCAFVIIMPSD